MKTSDEKLDAVIQLLECDTRGLVVEAEEQASILGWLKELRETRAELVTWVKAKIMQVLTDRKLGCHGLTQEEADRVWEKFGAHTMPEFEAGPCRLCEATGKAEHFGTDVFGYECSIREQCFTCSGSGTDPKRIKIPS